MNETIILDDTDRRILRQFQAELVPGALITPEFAVALRPRGGLWMTVRPRGGA